MKYEKKKIYTPEIWQSFAKARNQKVAKPFPSGGMQQQQLNCMELDPTFSSTPVFMLRPKFKLYGKVEKSL